MTTYCTILILPEETAHFPKLLDNTLIPQLLGVFANGRFCRFHIETLHLHTRQAGGMHQIPPEHHHQVFHVILYVYGSGNFRCEGKTIEANRGTLVLTSPGIPHCFASTAMSMVVYHELTFSLKDHGNTADLSFNALFNHYFAGKRKVLNFPLALSERECEELEEKFFELEKALRHYQDENLFFPYKHAAALLEQVYLLGYAAVDADRITRQPPPNIMIARGLLERELNQPLRLRDVARKTGTSPEHLCREFKKIFGISPLHYRLQMRITAAERLLAYSTRPLKDIAAELGFTDEHHFSKTFKKINGEPPGRFRASAR